MHGAEAERKNADKGDPSMSANTTAAPLIGPRDRESFFEAQRRNGRATWRLSAVCVLAAIVMGIPLALTITPLLYAAALLIADIVSIWAPLPASFWQHSIVLREPVNRKKSVPSQVIRRLPRPACPALEHRNRSRIHNEDTFQVHPLGKISRTTRHYLRGDRSRRLFVHQGLCA